MRGSLEEGSLRAKTAKVEPLGNPVNCLIKISLGAFWNCVRPSENCSAAQPRGPIHLTSRYFASRLGRTCNANSAIC